MPSKQQSCNSLCRTISRVVTVAPAVAIVFTLTVVLISSAQDQTFKVLHNFTGGVDGAYPFTGLSIDTAGNLYGTTFAGAAGYGTVFKLNHSASRWVLTTLYTFAGGKDGAGPYGRVALGQDGTLYGTTVAGGEERCNYSGWPGCGTVFHLRPSPVAPQSLEAPWNQTVLYRFTGGYDGAAPQGDVTFDRSGNIYGTTNYGGKSFGLGVVYELTASEGGWTQTVLYSPQSYAEGAYFYGGVVFSRTGDLYGVFSGGGPYGYGGAYKLSPSGSSWAEQTIYGFTGASDGYGSVGLILDSSGNLYGTTEYGGSGGGGTVFELSPANDGWNFNTLYSFSGGAGNGPWDKLVMDDAGNLYGTTAGAGGYGNGSVFKLTPSNGSWTYTSLHDFTGGSDGALPISNVAFDANGNLYGTASIGGAYGDGVVWEIAP